MADAKVTVGIPTYNRSALLRESIVSVLAQSYRDFRLLVCDNASEDDTCEVVRSFKDPRIDYVRSETNIGLVPNQNRVMELAETEFLLILPDDDLLYPDHLREAVAVLEEHPRVGVVHTAFDLIGPSGDVVERDRLLVEVHGHVGVEPGQAFLDRSMSAPWLVCWPSALFRRSAMVEAEGQRVADVPLPDFPLLMRVACAWDVACVSRALAATRVHAGSATAAIGAYTEGGYALDTLPRILYEHRLRFLDEADLPSERAARYRAQAHATYRRESVAQLADRAGAGASWVWAWSALFRLVREHPRTLLLPVAWKLIVAQLGGRPAKHGLARLRQRRESSVPQPK